MSCKGPRDKTEEEGLKPSARIERSANKSLMKPKVHTLLSTTDERKATYKSK